MATNYVRRYQIHANGQYQCCVAIWIFKDASITVFFNVSESENRQFWVFLIEKSESKNHQFWFIQKLWWMTGFSWKNWQQTISVIMGGYLVFLSFWEPWLHIRTGALIVFEPWLWTLRTVLITIGGSVPVLGGYLIFE